MIQHHPDDDLLLGHAAGKLDSGRALVVASHLELCAHCRERVRLFETVGGAMLEDVTPADVSAQALAQTWAAIDSPAPRPSGRQRPAGTRPELPAGMAWPRALKDCQASRWRWIAPGMRWCRVKVPYDPAANVFLLRIGAGKCLPFHTHSDNELTQVLHGAFHDGRALFGPGDFDEADPSILHEPKVLAQGECICLASVRGKVLFQGVVARWMGAIVGL
ncbi:ChrR family anti-sigma-E factor [Variovorax sp. J22R133]|uniref:ChrR family anti-sigma-E factor n=1 Tax=Variovorax brevis TaxID=3053503 RepID=UPI002576B816|nr:ChrR family anti-sigma-E factor [Variovorax sp. J22R133]MDM0111146.1 ChrR family anti-sigma-E factor [Variovorax sp. J22R133]